jgi:hypothetical protein
MLLKIAFTPFCTSKMRIVTRRVIIARGIHNFDSNKKSSISNDSKIPRGLRGLSVASFAEWDDTPSEYDELLDDAADVERSWATPRFQHIKRVYSGKNFL